MRQVNNVRSTRWYACARCDQNFPEALVKVRNGLVLCTGPGTHRCGDDEVGHAGAVRAAPLPREESIPELPTEVIDL